MTQNTPTLSGNFLLSYDFYLGGTALAGDAWDVVGFSAQNNGDRRALFNVFMDDFGRFTLTDGGDGLRSLLNLNPATWYHVEIQGSLTAGMYRGSITPDGTMIAAPVQGDVDGIPKGSHYTKAVIDLGPPDQEPRPGDPGPLGYWRLAVDQSRQRRPDSLQRAAWSCYCVGHNRSLTIRHSLACFSNS